jgi:WD40 repeat protein
MDVFLSYSRRDLALVRPLHEAVQQAGHDVWVDWEDIPPTAEWLEEIYRAIDAADAFLFVASPDSAASVTCGIELSHAVKRNKRLVVLVARDVDPAAVPEAIRKLQWIFVRDGEERGKTFEVLTTALVTDLERVRAHTRLLLRAREWAALGKDKSYLLRGGDLGAAERWLADEREPAATAEQKEYVAASRAHAQSVRRLLIGSLAAVLVIGSILLAVALNQRRLAQERRREAVFRQSLIAARREQDRYPSLAALLAREAVRIHDDPQAREALFQALARNDARQRLVLPGELGRASLSRDGTLILTGTGSEAAIWRATDGRRIATLPAGRDLHAAAFSPDGTKVLTITKDGAALWDLHGRRLAAFPVLTGYDETRLAWSPAGDRFFTVAGDNNARLWDLSGKLIGRVPLLSGSASWSPDGRHLLDGPDIYDAAGKKVARAQTRESWKGVAWRPAGDRFLSYGESQPVRIWDLRGKEVGAVGGPRDVVNDAAWSAGGDRIVSIAGGASIWSLDGTRVATVLGLGRIIAWDEYLVANCFDEAVCICDAAGNRVGIIELGPFAKGLIAAGAARGNILTRSWEGKVAVWTLDIAPPAELAGHGSDVNDAAWSPDGKQVLTVSYDRTARLWSASGTPLWTSERQRAGLRNAAWTADGAHFFTVDQDGGALLWDAATHRSRPASYFWSPDRRLFITAAGEVLDVEGGRRCKVPMGKLTPRWSPDGRLIATAGALFDLAGKRVAPLGDQATLTDIVWSPASDRLLTVADNSIGTIRDLQGRPLASLRGEPATITDAAWSPDGKLIATTSTRIYQMQIWDASDGRRLARVPGVFTEVAWRPDSRTILTLDFTTGALWNVEGSKLAELAGHASRISSATWSPSGDRILTTSYDHTARIRDAAGKPLVELTGHDDIVWRGTWSPDARRVLTVSADGTARIWPTVPLTELSDSYLTRALSEEERKAYLEIK